MHADHRSGARELAAKSGAPVYLHRSAGVASPFTPLDDGTRIDLGNVILQVLHTPGHTPESICLLVVDRTRSDEPWAVLTGDTLFVGDIGRPDFGGPGDAKMLHASLHETLLRLPTTSKFIPRTSRGAPAVAR